MQEICERCGAWRPDQIIAPDGRSMSCPVCGFVSPLRRGPLFVVTGASGAGKSAALRLLYQEERDYLVMESDILWEDRWQDPEGRYTAYFNLWLRVCKNIGQGGRPVVLGGCMAPHQLEPCVERRYFSAVHYLALVTSPEELRRRLQSRPAWRRCGDEGTIAAAVQYNAWLRENAGRTDPPMALLDTQGLSLAQAAAAIDRFVRARLTEG